MSEMKSLTLDGKTYDSFVDKEARESIKNLNPGGSGTPGENGGYYTPKVEQTDANTMKVSYTASKEGMAAVADQNITLPAGPKGDKYELTEADKQEIAEQAAQLVDVPEGDTAELFFAVYGETTYAEVTEALDDGKMVYVKYDTSLVPYVGTSGNHYFQFINNYGFFVNIALHSDNKWDSTSKEYLTSSSLSNYYNKNQVDDLLDGLDTGGSNQPLTFTGAVNATYDGSEAVSVEIPQGGGGGSEWKVIANVTLEEEVQTVTFTVDADGNPFALTDEIMLCAKLLPNAEAKTSGYTMLTAYSGAKDTYGTGLIRSNSGKGVPATGQYCIYRYYKFNSAKNTFMPVTIMEAVNTYVDYTNTHGADIFEAPSTKQAIPVDKLSFNAYAKMGVGSTIRIYGR
jgi:hypothetical protein